MNQALEDQVLECLLSALYSELSVKDLQPGMRLYDDLGLDSLSATGLILELEDSCEVSLCEQEVWGLESVQDVLELVAQKQTERYKWNNV